MNITPNSFSDGGETFSQDSLAEKWKIFALNYRTLWGIDVGAESTAPGKAPLSFEDEWERWLSLFLPTLEKVEDLFPSFRPVLSIDTYRPEIFRRLYALIHNRYPMVWNDVTGLWDQEVVDVLLSCPEACYVHGHSLLERREHVQSHLLSTWPEEGIDFVKRLQLFFRQRQEQVFGLFGESGLQRVIWDPCWGFSKKREQNLALLTHFPWFLQGLHPKSPWMIGLSRKSFLREANFQNWEQAEWRQSVWLTTLLRSCPLNPLFLRVHRPELAEVALELAPSLPS